MKIFPFSLLSWLLLLGSNLGCDVTGDQLVHSHRSFAVRFLSWRSGYSLERLPLNSHHLLVELVRQYYPKNLAALFKIIQEKGSIQVAHFIVLVIKFNLHIMDMWIEHLDSDMVNTKFFKRSKKLISFLFKQKDWSGFREAIFTLISIQRQYLYYLKQDTNKLETVEEWIKGYEFIYHSFDPSDSYLFLNLYHSLRMMALKYNGVIPKFDPPKSYILNSLKLFKVYKHHFYEWEKLDIYTLEPELLYLLLLDQFPKQKIFDFLANPKISPPHFCEYSFDFLGIIKSFEMKTALSIKITTDSFQRNSFLYQFMKGSVKNGDVYNFERKKFQYLEALLYVISALGGARYYTLQSEIE